MRVQSFIIVMALPFASNTICFAQISTSQPAPSIVKSTGRPQNSQSVPTSGPTTAVVSPASPTAKLLDSKPPEAVRRPVSVRPAIGRPVTVQPAVGQPAVGQPVAGQAVRRVSHEQTAGTNSAPTVATAAGNPSGAGQSPAPVTPVVDVAPPSGRVAAQPVAASRGVQLQAMVPMGEQPSLVALPKAGSDDGLLLLQPILPRTGAGAAPGVEAAKVPFEVLQMTRLTGTSTDKPIAGVSATTTLSTQSMIGPLEDPSAMFGKLNTTPVPAVEPLSPVRTQLGQVQWAPDVYTWVTPTFYHKPLYFEQPNLERYGMGTYRWLQPAASSAHFFSSIALMPYKALTQHPLEHVYTLGYDRPGNCAAYQGRPLLGQSTVGEACKVYDPYSGY